MVTPMTQGTGITASGFSKKIFNYQNFDFEKKCLGPKLQKIVASWKILHREINWNSTKKLKLQEDINKQV